MAALTVKTTDRSSGSSSSATTDNAVSAAGGGDTFTNNGATLLYIRNAGGSGITLTMAITATYDGQASTNKTATVDAGETLILGPFDVGVYGSTVTLTYSAVTSVTVLAFTMGAGTSS